MRDAIAARKFAVKWSTKSEGEIANLGGCYLQALAEVERLTKERDEARTMAERCMNAIQGVVMPNDWSIEPYRIITSWSTPKSV